MQLRLIGVIELCDRKRRVLLHPLLIIIQFYCRVDAIGITFTNMARINFD